MLSQLTKTIKMALKSTDEERAVLRARSAVQRFPVVEWRQRMEDFHSRSVLTSRSVAGNNAWRPSDSRTPNLTPVGLEAEDWNPENASDNHAASDTHSGHASPAVGPASPGSPGQWSDDAMSAQGDYLTAPRLRRRGSISTDVSEDDYFSHSRDGMEPRQEDYGGFLSRANRQIARDQKHVADPFLDSSPAPNRPFGEHSRVSSVESISSIVDEKTDSPLNKAIATVCFLKFSLVNIAHIRYCLVHRRGWRGCAGLCS